LVSRVLAGLALPLALVAASPVVAGAATEGYGELTRFGESGSGAGQINGEEHRSTEEQRSRLIGVDPSNNSVFVLDEPRDYEQARKKPTREEEEECIELEVPLEECGVPTGPVKRHFRLQKFTLSGGRYQPAGAVQFDEEAPNGAQGPTRMGAEGVAVDPAHKRVYVLAVDARTQKAKVDVEARNGPGRTGNLPVASTLFAFTTELLPAGKAGKNKEILTGPGAGELEAQSEVPGHALLEPGGIAVDPETGDVIVVAHEDPSGAGVDQVFDSKEGASPDHYVLQRIHAGGEVVGGTAGRYIDAQNFFKQTDFLDFKPPAPNSPIVIGGAGEEQVYLVYERGLAAVPADFSTKAPPAYRYRPLEQFAAAEGRIALTQTGGALSAAPAGA